jgi:hypothetical protein
MIVMKDYAYFERKLIEAGQWEDKVRVCLEGIFNNVFLRGAKIISDIDLETLRLRFPELYETVKDNDVRKGLVISELFKVAYKHPPLRRCEDEEVEIEIDSNSPHGCGYTWCLLTSIRQDDFRNSEELYGGVDAVKIFFKSVYFIAEELDAILNYPVLADPWRTKSGLESKSAKLREVMYSKFREIAEEAKVLSRPESIINTMVYALYYWYRSVGKRVKRKLEKLIGFNKERNKMKC